MNKLRRKKAVFNSDNKWFSIEYGLRYDRFPSFYRASPILNVPWSVV